MVYGLIYQFPKHEDFLLVVCTVFQIPRTISTLNFMNEFNEILDVVSSEGKEIILLGDLSCDLLKHPGKFTPSVTKCFKSLLQMWNFSVCVNNRIRVSDISSSLIDIIATTVPGNIARSWNVPVGISDRDLVYCVRKLNCSKGSPSIKTFRNFSRYDHKIF